LKPSDILPEKPRVVLLIGLPGSGKSTYAEHLPVLSSDAMRILLADDVNNQTIHGRVFETLRFLLRQRLAIRRPLTYIDATHIRQDERKPYFEIARECDCDVEAVFFNIPLEVCLDRNRHRVRQVPEDALIAMAARLQPPQYAEGFTRIEIL
jgi:predicted kinase